MNLSLLGLLVVIKQIWFFRSLYASSEKSIVIQEELFRLQFFVESHDWSFGEA